MGICSSQETRAALPMFSALARRPGRITDTAEGSIKPAASGLEISSKQDVMAFLPCCQFLPYDLTGVGEGGSRRGQLPAMAGSSEIRPGHEAMAVIP